MRKFCNVSPAAMDTLNGSTVAVFGGGMKPVLDDIRCFARQSPPPEFRQVEQFNRMSPNRAFSISAVLHTIASAQVGGVELTDERNHVSASRGRGAISQDAQDVGIKGLNHSATVSSARAVADADSSEPTMKLHAGTANRTVSGIGFNPTPALGWLSPKKESKMTYRTPPPQQPDLAKQAAMLAGQPTFIGSRCKYGHDGTRYTSTGNCKFCVKLHNSKRKLKGE